MAYTNAWTDGVPLGTEAAKNIDDFMRRERLDIHERMNDVVVDWTADPVVPKSFTSTDLIRIIPYSEFMNDYHGVTLGGVFEGYAVGASGSGPYVAPVGNIIPKNATITNIQFTLSPEVGGGITWGLKLISSPFPATGVFTTEFSITTAIDGLQTLDSGVIAVVLDSVNKYYILSLKDTAGAAGKLVNIYAAKFTYTL